jgi:hypothetical protein
MTSEQSGASSPKRVIRDVDPAAVGDLRDRPPRASVAFVEGDAVDVLPATARFSLDVYQFAVLADVSPDLTHREVVLVIDDGPYWFELRGISVRGIAERLAAGAGGLAWYAIDARRILAWDYGAIREE